MDVVSPPLDDQPVPPERTPLDPTVRAVAHAMLVGSVLAALGAIAAFAWLASKRVGRPYELEWMEGAMVQHVARVVNGEHIYVRPTMSFVPFLYNPLYYWVSACVARVVGVGFLALRLVSIVSSFATFGLIFALVYRETRAAVPGLLAAGMFASTYAVTGSWLDLGRVDALALALCFGAMFVAQRAATRPALVFAGLLTALAFATRQNAGPLLPALWLHLLLARGFRQSLWFGGTALAILGLGALALDHATGGWYRFYALELPFQHESSFVQLLAWWRPYVLVAFGFIAYFLYRSRTPPDSRRFFVLSSLALGAMWLMARAHTGSYYNDDLAAVAPLSVGFGLGVAALVEDGAARPHHASAFAYGLALLQIALLLYDPRPYAPSPDDDAAAAELSAAVSAASGDVMVLEHGWVTPKAGKPGFAHCVAVDDVMRSGSDPRGVKRKLAREYEAALSSHRFTAIFIDAPSRFPGPLHEYYEVGGSFPVRRQAPLFGAAVVETRYVYVPKR